MKVFKYFIFFLDIQLVQDHTNPYVPILKVLFVKEPPSIGNGLR
jgi:hypothetical protein